MLSSPVLAQGYHYDKVYTRQDGAVCSRTIRPTLSATKQTTLDSGQLLPVYRHSGRQAPFRAIRPIAYRVTDRASHVTAPGATARGLTPAS